MAEDERLSFAVLLKQQRRLSGLTQEELAERAGYSPAYISSLERGVRTHLATTAQLLADSLALAPEARSRLLAAGNPLVAQPRRGAVAEHPGPAARGTVIEHPGPADRGVMVAHPGPPARGGASGQPVPVGRAGPALVGRRRELDRIERHLAGAGAAVLLLTGEPGIGKTRLLQEALVLFQQLGARKDVARTEQVLTTDHHR